MHLGYWFASTVYHKTRFDCEVKYGLLGWLNSSVCMYFLLVWFANAMREPRKFKGDSVWRPSCRHMKRVEFLHALPIVLVLSCLSHLIQIIHVGLSYGNNSADRSNLLYICNLHSIQEYLNGHHPTTWVEERPCSPLKFLGVTETIDITFISKEINEILL